MTIKSFVFNDWQECTFVLSDEQKNGCIVDPGCYTQDEEDALFSYISQEKISIEKILITHAHHDHIFGLKEALERFPVKTYAHFDDHKVLDAFPKIMSAYGVHITKFPPTKFDIHLSTGDTVTFGSIKLDVFHTPGHSPGSISFYSAEDNVVFTGDILFQNSVGRTDIAFGDYDTLVKSIVDLGKVLPPETQYLPGHGVGRSLKEELQENPYVR